MTRTRRQRRRRSQTGLHSALQSVGGTFLPPRRTVIVETQWSGYVAASNVSTSGNFASVIVNSLYQPYNTPSSNSFTNAIGGYPFVGVSSGGASITASPIGYNYLSSNYNTYKVLEYEVEFTVTPQNSGDTVAMSMAPLGNQEQPTTGTWNFFRMAGQRFAQTGRAVNGANSRLNTLRYSGKVWVDLGLTRAQWLATGAPQAIMGSQPTGGNVDYFGFLISTLDGAANGSPVVVDCIIRQKVIVSDPVQYGN